jgi:hypothetical protein
MTSRNRKTAGTCTFAIGGATYSADSFVVAESSVLRTRWRKSVTCAPLIGICNAALNNAEFVILLDKKIQRINDRGCKQDN